MINNLKHESLGKKIFVSLICALIFIILSYPLSFIYPIPGISEYKPSGAIAPAFGLMFGPWGAIGSAIGAFIIDMSLGYDIEVCLILSLFRFLYAYIPYKLWYTFSYHGSITVPRLNTVKNLIKFVLITLLNSTLMTWLYGFYTEMISYVPIASFVTILWEINSLDFTLLFGTILLTLASIFKFKLYIPEKKNNPIFSHNFYNVIIIIALSIAIIYTIYSYFYIPLYNGLIFGTIYILLIIILAFKPITEKVKIKDNTVQMSITEKLITFFITIGTIIVILAGIILFIENSPHYISNFGSVDVLFVNLAIILFIFYLVVIYVLSKIEKEITLPIESISSATNEYINSKNKMEDSKEIINQIKKDKPDNTEIGILANSFIKMISDLKTYMQKLKKETNEKEKFNTELEIAKKIQDKVISKKFPTIEELDLYGINISAKEIGGDFYDFFFIDNNHFAIVIGDISGKGIPASLFMLKTKTLIKNYMHFKKSPSEAFFDVNNSLCENNDENMFLTAWIGILEINTGRLVYVNAGHTPPLIKKGKSFEWLKSASGLVLGAEKNKKFSENEITLNKNDEIFLYTDGITDANNIKKEFFGSERLISLLNENSKLNIKSLANKVKNEINKFSEGTEQFDDICLLILKYKK
ncbi:SpoIIE family protein phosphatase [Methanobrevibacter sp. DSM 116169]|uniref:SpoIIE family protein phosphatase n=1 Tax=Methanobrevibacter sp. DSM 116169 TaxID=3242727 RepID=UPI0038FBF1FF